MNTQSNNRPTISEASPTMRETLQVGDWVETGWSLAVGRSGHRFNFLRTRAVRPDLTINNLVPPLSRAVLSNHRSHLIVGRSN